MSVRHTDGRWQMQWAVWPLLMACLVNVKAAGQNVEDMSSLSKAKSLEGAVGLLDAAFSTVSRNIRPIAIEHVTSGEELEREFQKHLRKDKVPDAVLFRYKDAIRSFTPEAFALLLPQFLSYGLRDPQSEAGDYVIYFLESAKVGHPYYDERLGHLSAQQLEALDLGLRFFDIHHCANDPFLREKIGTATRVLTKYRERLARR